MTTEPISGPTDDAVARQRRGASLRAWARRNRFGIAVAAVVASAVVAAGLVTLAFPITGGTDLVPPSAITVSDAAGSWSMSPTDAFGALPTPSASPSAVVTATATAAPSSAAPKVSSAPPKTRPKTTPTPGPVGAALPASYEAEGPGAVRSSATRLRHVRDASGGYVVGNLGRGETLRFTVAVPAAGRYGLTLYYISGDRRFLTGRINGGSAFWGAVPTTRDWYTVGSVTVPVDLSAGGNTVELGNPRDYAPDIDRIVVR